MEMIGFTRNAGQHMIQHHLLYQLAEESCRAHGTDGKPWWKGGPVGNWSHGGSWKEHSYLLIYYFQEDSMEIASEQNDAR